MTTIQQDQIRRLGGIPERWATLRPKEKSNLLPAAGFGSLAGFPTTGRQPVSKEGFIADLRFNTIEGPSLSRQAIFSNSKIGTDVTGVYNSVFMLASDDCTALLSPGVQSWALDSCAFYSVPIQAVQKIRLTAHRSFVFQMIFSSQPDPLIANPITFHQEAWGTQTLTKVNGVGVADDWTTVNFTASDGKNQLDPALWGDTSLHTGSIGAKNWIITNDDATNNVDMNIQQLNVSGKTWADDPVTGPSATLNATDVANLQTARYGHLFRVRMRVNAASAASQTAAITAQYRGFAAGF